jgi:hypothetical protein
MAFPLVTSTGRRDLRRMVDWSVRCVEKGGLPGLMNLEELVNRLDAPVLKIDSPQA